MVDQLRRPLLVAAGLVWRPGPLLLVQRRRADAAHGARTWELPGGKLESAESPRAALIRELLEEWGPVASTLRVGPVVDVVHHIYSPPGPELLLIVYHVDADALGPPGTSLERLGLRPEPGVEVGQFSPQELPITQFLGADQPLLADVRDKRITRPTFIPL